MVSPDIDQNRLETRLVKLKKQFWGVDAIGWTGLLVAIGVGVTLDNITGSNKWHAATVWTLAAFYGAILFGKSKWKSWRFWALLTFWFGVHLLGMWYLFARLVPDLRVGTLLVIPVGFLESIFLPVMALRLGKAIHFPIDAKTSHYQS